MPPAAPKGPLARGPAHGPDDGSKFVRENWRPAYDELLRTGELEERVRRAHAMMAGCTACPCACGADRAAGETGVCGTAREAIVASAFPHLGEESCLVGRRGSGTIFFSHCNLHCVFCQNYALSQHRDGEPAPPERIAELALQLQAWGCHNLNLVTPEHVVPQVVEALALAVGRGLEIPVVYNTSAYDSVDSLRLLDGLVDVYMPDFKFWTPALARRYCGAEDYPERARAALREMHRQVGPLTFDGGGLAVRGLLVRHLVLPGLGEESAAIFHFLAAELSPDTYVNVMAQYRPNYLVGMIDGEGRRRYAELDRRPVERELADAYEAARAAGLWRFAD
jgi:putative pyruvate formate lyase activating enzyme